MQFAHNLHAPYLLAVVSNFLKTNAQQMTFTQLSAECFLMFTLRTRKPKIGASTSTI